MGFIQKLPTQLVAAFRATLEELGESTLLLHMVDVSSPNAAAQTDTVLSVLEELGIDLPIVTVWNKVNAPLQTVCAVSRMCTGRRCARFHITVTMTCLQVDLCADPELVRRVAAGRKATVCISALTGAF